MNNVLPEGITWSDTHTLRCDRCKASRVVKSGQHFDFITEHASCESDPSAKLATAMTMREYMATQFATALVGHDITRSGRVLGISEAVRAADMLIAELRAGSGANEGTGISPELFERAAATPFFSTRDDKDQS